MRHLSFLLVLVLICSCTPKTPKADHVVFMCFDAMSAVGIQRAETPNFNRMIDRGAVSIHTRCGRPTNSSPNWMTMASATPFEMHGVLDNGITPINGTVYPALKNEKGFYPTIFEYIRQQRPEAKMYIYSEYPWMGAMYDMSVFDRVVPEMGKKKEKRVRLSPDEAIHQAADAFVQDRPELMFIAIGTPDHEGHTWGHESQGYLDCLHHMDELVGDFVKTLEDNGMMKNTVIIITADHGGFYFAHGGDTMAELEVPVIMYGGPVTKGKVMEHVNMNYDVPATVAGLLGVELPWECHGKMLQEPFQPVGNVCYVPVPMVHPFRGVVKEGEKVNITCDCVGVEVYYTLDGSQPTEESTRYEGPFELNESATVRAVAVKNGTYSIEAANFLFASVPGGEDCVSYNLYRHYDGVVLPDFSTMGRPSASGMTGTFSLDGLPFEASEDHFAVEFDSRIKIPAAGNYKFELMSDDGSKLYIDGRLVIDNDKSHTLMNKLGTIELTEGVHSIRVEYFEDSDGQNLFLNFCPENGQLRPVIPADLSK